MAQNIPLPQPSKRRTEDAEVPGGIPIKSPTNTDASWKAVGSPSRRGSLSMTAYMHSPSNSPRLNASDLSEHPATTSTNASAGPRRSSIVDNQQWGSFGGFQWEGPSLFNEDNHINDHWHPHHTDVMDDPNLQLLNNNSILSVPMLPGVSLEPIYRQQRSLSFSMGQDPTFFGYDDYEDGDEQGYKTSLATMEEEEEVLEDELDQLSAARFRARSKSSGAAFGLLSSQQRAHLQSLRRGSEQQDDILSQRRRSSTQFWNAANAPMSMGDKERLELLQRRLSTASSATDYTFPTDGPSGFNLLQQRRHSLNQATPTNIQQLAEQLEQTHLLRHDYLMASNPPPPPTPQFYQPMPPQGFSPYHHHLIQQQHPHHIHPHQRPMPTNDDGLDPSDARALNDIGKGVPLQRLPTDTMLYMIEFKAGRTDFFYAADPQLQLQVGDLVIVEADRGKDLGKIARSHLSVDQIAELQARKQQQQAEKNPEDTAEDAKSREVNVKRIYRLAMPDEINLLLVKDQDEHRALAICQQKTKQRKLPMEVVDAEYQWDRRKLTFYFVADRRIDFRELVRELFKMYKTRIWMCAVNPPST
ncbi:PSP1 C-terminal conserved region-domain-containing protein [Radiomyces spectabilis]|uniref:PSP1 C-terminal conserved region-domain-containing protein n=1 Tax=Radiomyces spectabilis TaxID=64574 RepID=UPI00221E6322|nr:PSP1 C-terminal conserved region-domain-containing protein [Radiomyces spectabilis]KAI8381322.1 PSP1 C-terminal conserved region-domain-containing protein [Radiomyces spectabilis]